MTAENITIARLVLRKGCFIRTHHHLSEQITTVLSGWLRFCLEDGERFVRAGETLVIPPDMPHSVEALETTTALDVFSPVRQDWIDGTDDYLKGQADR